jgi:hypothetical protein
MAEERDVPERPRAEPEIIPPDRSGRESDWRQQTWRPQVSFGSGQTHRIYIGRPGPLGLILLMLIVGIIVAVILLVVLGAFLIWIPILALLVLAGAVFRLLRR